MPLYHFKNKETGEESSLFMRISEQDDFLNANPELEIVIKPVLIVSGVGDLKPDNGFRDVLKRIKKASGKTNTIETF
jgi:hypothetical protein